MTVIDLDVSRTPRRTPLLPAPAIAYIITVAVLFAVLVVVLAWRGGPAPALHLSAQWSPGSSRVPTALVWYRDGTQEDITEAIGADWRPDRPVRLVTVVAEVACAITVDGELAASARSAAGRYAVCTWTP